MATITIQNISLSGITPSYAAANDGDVFANTGSEYLHVKNGGGSQITVTVTPAKPTLAVQNYGSMTKAAVSVAVEATAEAIIGPFERTPFNDTSAETTINYSGVTSVTAGVFKLPKTI